MNWIDEMIQREAMPMAARIDTIGSFCKQHNIEEKDYLRELRKDENKKKILEETLGHIASSASDIFQVLKEKALEGEMKAIEMFLDYVLKLSKKLDVNASGTVLIQMAQEIAQKHNLLSNDTTQNPGDNSEGQTPL